MVKWELWLVSSNLRLPSAPFPNEGLRGWKKTLPKKVLSSGEQAKQNRSGNTHTCINHSSFPPCLQIISKPLFSRFSCFCPKVETLANCQLTCKIVSPLGHHVQAWAGVPGPASSQAAWARNAWAGSLRQSRHDIGRSRSVSSVVHFGAGP